MQKYAARSDINVHVQIQAELEKAIVAGLTASNLLATMRELMAKAKRAKVAIEDNTFGLAMLRGLSLECRRQVMLTSRRQTGSCFKSDFSHHGRYP